MNKFSLPELDEFILQAKSSSYVGGAAHIQSCRPASHDLQFKQGEWAYLDSYFGGANFIGEEVVWYAGTPVWALNYYGYILKPELITSAQTGQIIQTSLARMYAENRFLGGFQHHMGDSAYFDTSEGDVSRFTGKEWIEVRDTRTYELVYHGGLILE